jgi:ribose transport system substrate-binding protein
MIARNAGGRRQVRRYRLALAVSVCGVIAAASLSACSSAPAASTESTGSSASATTAAAISAADQALAVDNKPPTDFTVAAVPSKPPAGKTIVFLDGGVPQTKLIAQGIQAAATALGWNFKDLILDQTSPTSVQQSFEQALVYHPYAVATDGTPYASWSSVLPEYQKAGVIVVPANVIGNPGNPAVPTMDVAGTYYYTHGATMLADWFIANSKGTGHALLVDVSGFTQSDIFDNAFTAEVNAHCSTCSLTTTSISITAAVGGTAGSSIVGVLRRNPGVKYVMNLDSAFMTDLSSSLAAAGLTDVQWGGESGDEQDLSSIHAGGTTEAVTTATPLTIIGWLIVDAAVRHLENVAYPSDYGHVPTELLSKSNLANWQVGPSFNEPSGYASMFEQAWHVG